MSFFLELCFLIFLKFPLFKFFFKFYFVSSFKLLFFLLELFRLSFDTLFFTFLRSKLIHALLEPFGKSLFSLNLSLLWSSLFSWLLFSFFLFFAWMLFALSFFPFKHLVELRLFILELNHFWFDEFLLIILFDFF